MSIRRVSSVFALGVTVFWGTVLSGLAGSKTEDLRSYFSNSPVVTNFVFVRILRTSESDSVTNFYMGAWQTNAFLLRNIHLNRDVPTSWKMTGKEMFYAGRSSQENWYVQQNTILTSDRNGTTEKERSVEMGVSISEEILRSALNLGIQNINPGSLIWSGNKFRTVNLDGHEIEGELKSSNDLPSRIYYRLKKGGKVFTYFVNLYYSEESVSFFPSQFEMYRLNGEESRLVTKVSVKSFQTSPAPMPDSAFRSETLSLTNSINIIATNNTFVQKTGTGIVPVVSKDTNSRASSSQRRSIALWTVAGLCGVAAFLYLFSKQSRSNRRM